MFITVLIYLGFGLSMLILCLARITLSVRWRRVWITSFLALSVVVSVPYLAVAFGTDEVWYETLREWLPILPGLGFAIPCFVVPLLTTPIVKQRAGALVLATRGRSWWWLGGIGLFCLFLFMPLSFIWQELHPRRGHEIDYAFLNMTGGYVIGLLLGVLYFVVGFFDKTEFRTLGIVRVGRLNQWVEFDSYMWKPMFGDAKRQDLEVRRKQPGWFGSDLVIDFKTEEQGEIDAVVARYLPRVVNNAPVTEAAGSTIQ